MKKFFLFKRREVSKSSELISDTGEGLDILAIPTDSLSFITASYGKVCIVFNDSTIYEESKLLDGESFQKTTVVVACEPGSEEDLIRSIVSFIDSGGVKSNIILFDAVQGVSNMPKATFGGINDVSSQVRQLPTDRYTQEVSKKTFIGGTDGTSFGTDAEIGDVNFGKGNEPFLDYTEENMTDTAGNVTAWSNAGTGGNTYDISTVVGTIPLDTSTGRSNNGLATQAADMDTGDNFTLPSAYQKSGEFTMFAVIGRSISDIQNNPKMGFLVQGSTSSGQGLTLAFVDAYDNTNYMFKFATEKGEYAMAPSDTPIIDSGIDANDMRTAYVWVIRRDTDNNIFIHDVSGRIVATAFARVEGANSRTDGNLVVKYLGNGIGQKFQGNLARFGVIERDIGTASASKLAQDLAKKYTPTT